MELKKYIPVFEEIHVYSGYEYLVMYDDNGAKINVDFYNEDPTGYPPTKHVRFKAGPHKTETWNVMLDDSDIKVFVEHAYSLMENYRSFRIESKDGVHKGTALSMFKLMKDKYFSILVLVDTSEGTNEYTFAIEDDDLKTLCAILLEFLETGKVREIVI